MNSANGQNHHGMLLPGTTLSAAKAGKAHKKRNGKTIQMCRTEVVEDVMDEGTSINLYIAILYLPSVL
jgi:hypothetical protein